LSHRKPLNGYLDRTRKTLEALDESIETVRCGPKGEKPAEQRARLKLLRDLIEHQTVILEGLKGHLLGRSVVGTVNEPPDHYGGNPQIEFERYFRNMLAPWTEDDLKLRCEDCGIKSEEVSTRDHVDLCGKCHAKRQATQKVLECDLCHIKSEDVSVRKFPGSWIGNYLAPGKSYDLCSKCYKDKRKSETSDGEIRDAQEDGISNEALTPTTSTLTQTSSSWWASANSEEVAEPVSRGEIKALLGGTANLLRLLKDLPLDQRVTELEKLLADKPKVAPGMEPGR